MPQGDFAQAAYVVNTRFRIYDDRMPDRPVPVVRIREATDADGPRLIALINTAFSVETFLEGTRTDEERLNATMRNGTILTAEDDAGQLLACVFYQVRGSRGYLGQLAVDPAFQGRGLARLIFAAAEDRLRAAGCTTADIVVLNLRPELLPIYRRWGYMESGIDEDFRPTRQLAPGFTCHGIQMSRQL